MSKRGPSVVARTLVTAATFLVATLLYALVVWLLILVGLPPGLSWIVAVLYPVIFGVTYVAVLFTSLGKYLVTLPPGSLG